MDTPGLVLRLLRFENLSILPIFSLVSCFLRRWFQCRFAHSQVFSHSATWETWRPKRPNGDSSIWLCQTVLNSWSSDIAWWFNAHLEVPDSLQAFPYYLQNKICDFNIVASLSLGIWKQLKFPAWLFFVDMKTWQKNMRLIATMAE